MASIDDQFSVGALSDRSLMFAAILLRPFAVSD